MYLVCDTYSHLLKLSNYTNKFEVFSKLSMKSDICTGLNINTMPLIFPEKLWV